MAKIDGEEAQAAGESPCWTLPGNYTLRPVPAKQSAANNPDITQSMPTFWDLSRKRSFIRRLWEIYAALV
jgi:hypothetical protein